MLNSFSFDGSTAGLSSIAYFTYLGAFDIAFAFLIASIIILFLSTGACEGKAAKLL
jgi:hypothetical protein